MRQKVLFTASTHSHLRNFHLPYIRTFHELGYEVHAACGGAAVDLPGVDRMIPLSFEKRMTSPKNLTALHRLRGLMKEEGYVLVSAHTSLAAFFTRLAARGLSPRPPVAVICHGYLFDDESSAVKKNILLAAERVAARDTDLLLTMNGWDLALAKKHRLGKRIAPIPGMGVDPTRLTTPAAGAAQALRGELGFDEAIFLLIYAAEFSSRKHQETLIRALPLLPERAALLLPGDGALRGTCAALAEQLGVADRVVFPGQISHMSPWYAAADCAVSSSRSEGLPFNIMEAMLLGLPLAASAVKGHVDLIRDGENGLLFPYGDAGACARCVGRLMAEPGLAQTLAAQARIDAELYTIDRVLPTVMDAYEQLLPAAQREAAPV